MKARLIRVARGLLYTVLIGYVLVSLIDYGLGVRLRADMTDVPAYILPSDNGKWVLEAYPYLPPGSKKQEAPAGGVYRIYSKDRALQAEIEVDNYEFYNDVGLSWFGNELSFGGLGDEVSVSLPTNWWVRFKANLP